MAKPVWSFAEFSALLDCPPSTLEEALEQTPGEFFLIGRRRYVTRDAGLQWIADRARQFPHVRRTKNTRSGI